MSGYSSLGAREIYRNPHLAVEVHAIVHPNGAEGEHILIMTPPSSAVVVADGGDLLFARQPRFAAGGDVLEVVKGGVDGGESAIDCAKRELHEELGIVATRWEPLGRLYEIPSIVASPVEIFLASGIEHVDAGGDPAEPVELVRIPEEVAITAAASGQINDAITVAALLRYGFFARGRYDSSGGGGAALAFQRCSGTSSA
jgi:ADP-ribose pyrophosphatase